MDISPKKDKEIENINDNTLKSLWIISTKIS